MQKEGVEISTEATAAQVGIGERLRGRGHRLAVESFVEDAFDGAVARTCKR